MIWSLPVFLLGLGLGGYIERYRWITWAKKHHPDEVNTTWL